MDAQLEGVPGLATLTVGGLAGGDLEVLGLFREKKQGLESFQSFVPVGLSDVEEPYRKADRTLDGEVLGAGTVDQLGADALEGLDLAAGEGDADAVSLLERGRRRN